jgi:hypothetical protein
MPGNKMKAPLDQLPLWQLLIVIRPPHMARGTGEYVGDPYRCYGIEQPELFDADR